MGRPMSENDLLTLTTSRCMRRYWKTLSDVHGYDSPDIHEALDTHSPGLALARIWKLAYEEGAKSAYETSDAKVGAVLDALHSKNGRPV